MEAVVQDKNAKTLGDMLHSARLKRNINLRQASRYIGIVPKYLSDIESNKKTPAGNTLEKIANFYGLDYQALQEMAKMAEQEILEKNTLKQG